MRGPNESTHWNTDMHTLIGIVVPIEGNPTEKAAIEGAEAYAESVVDYFGALDSFTSHKDTVQHWKSDAKIFRTDTEAGRLRLDEIKKKWKGIHVKLLKRARELLTKTDDAILTESMTICDIQRIGHYLESPLFGEEIGYISNLNVFDHIEPSWVVFLDFHY